jgi:hypothetical protein
VALCRHAVHTCTDCVNRALMAMAAVRCSKGKEWYRAALFGMVHTSCASPTQLLLGGTWYTVVPICKLGIDTWNVR